LLDHLLQHHQQRPLHICAQCVCVHVFEGV
jgi:hypothetical protein